MPSRIAPAGKALPPDKLPADIDDAVVALQALLSAAASGNACPTEEMGSSMAQMFI